MFFTEVKLSKSAFFLIYGNGHVASGWLSLFFLNCIFLSRASYNIGLNNYKNPWDLGLVVG